MTRVAFAILLAKKPSNGTVINLLNFLLTGGTPQPSGARKVVTSQEVDRAIPCLGECPIHQYIHAFCSKLN